MSDGILLALLVGIATYCTRIAGFRLGRRAMPPFVDRFLGYVPAAMFAALIAPDLLPSAGEAPPRLLGALAATAALLYLKQLWLGLAIGMAAYWLVRAL